MVEHEEVIGFVEPCSSGNSKGIVGPDGRTNVRRDAEKWKIINFF